MENRVCKVCGVKKSVLDFPKPIELELTTCNICKKRENHQRYLEKNYSKWRSYYNDYRKKYLSDDKSKFRQRMSAHFQFLKRIEEPEFIEFFENSDFCAICDKLLSPKEKTIFITEDYYNNGGDIMNKKEWNEIKDFTRIGHRSCILGFRSEKKFNTAKKKEKMEKNLKKIDNETDAPININIVTLTYIYYIANKICRNDKLNNILLPIDDPSLLGGIGRNKVNQSKYIYYKTNKFVKDNLISYFNINSGNVWEKKKQILDSIFDYIVDKTGDVLFADSIIFRFRLSIEKLCLNFHIMEYEKRDLDPS